MIRRTPHPRDRLLLLLKAMPQVWALERAPEPLLPQLVELADELEPEVRCELAAFMARSAELLIEQAAGVRPRRVASRGPRPLLAAALPDAGHEKVTPRRPATV